MTLILALFAMLTLTVTTLALLSTATTEPVIANNLLHGSQAFYVAESGLEIALVELNEGRVPDGSTRFIGFGRVVTVGIIIDTDHVHVIARGRVGSALRIVSNMFELDVDGRWQPLKQFKEEIP
jgi:hypothetical protein